MFMASACATELSMFTAVGTYMADSSSQGLQWTNSQNSVLIQLTFFTQSHIAMYSDSAKDAAMIDCFLDLHTTGDFLMPIIHPEA